MPPDNAVHCDSVSHEGQQNRKLLHADLHRHQTGTLCADRLTNNNHCGCAKGDIWVLVDEIGGHRKVCMISLKASHVLYFAALLRIHITASLCEATAMIRYGPFMIRLIKERCDKPEHKS